MPEQGTPTLDIPERYVAFVTAWIQDPLVALDLCYRSLCPIMVGDKEISQVIIGLITDGYLTTAKVEETVIQWLKQKRYQQGQYGYLVVLPEILILSSMPGSGFKRLSAFIAENLADFSTPDLKRLYWMFVRAASVADHISPKSWVFLVEYLLNRCEFDRILFRNLLIDRPYITSAHLSLLGLGSTIRETRERILQIRAKMLRRLTRRYPDYFGRAYSTLWYAVIIHLGLRYGKSLPEEKLKEYEDRANRWMNAQNVHAVLP